VEFQAVETATNLDEKEEKKMDPQSPEHEETDISKSAEACSKFVDAVFKPVFQAA
jgi:hypothetical protein